MTAKPTEQQVRATVRRHIGVSVAAGCVILALVFLDGLSPMVVVGAAVVVALVVAGTGMHLFSERPAIQVLIGFTVFFVFMLISWSYEAFTDKIEGTGSSSYGASAVHGEESH